MRARGRAKAQIVSTDAGIKNDFTDEHSQNAYSSMRISLDPDSKVNDESDLHSRKQRSQRTSTDAGRQIVFNDKQP
jgi:hypothetical protein